MTALPSETKRCLQCGQEKLRSDFYRDGRTTVYRDGRIAHNLRPYCKACFSVNQRRLRDADPVGVWAYKAISAAKKRARIRRVPFAITTAVLAALAPAMCPALGIPLDYACRVNPTRCGSSPFSATVDRLVPALGYVPANVRIISMKANLIKQDAAPDEIEAVAAYYRRELHQK